MINVDEIHRHDVQYVAPVAILYFGSSYMNVR